MRDHRFLAVLAVAIIATVITGAAGPAVAGPSSPSDWLSRYQAQYLDPQGREDGTAVSPAATVGMPGMDHSGPSVAADGSSFTMLPPEAGGRWDYLPPFPKEFNAVHVVTGPNGKILLIAGSGRNKANFAAGTFTSYIWDPVTDQRRMIPTPIDMFCAGHTLLPDGRALVGGGTIAYTQWKGSDALYAFDFATEQYDKLTNLEVGRWYPTAVTGADGRVLFVAGFDANGIKTNVTEAFDYRTNTHTVLPTRQNLPNYVHLHLAADGRFFAAGTSRPGLCDPYANRFTAVPGDKGQQLTSATMASCFVGDVRDQNLMTLGGGWPATSATRVIDLDAPTPTLTPGPPLPAAKAYASCVNLPDGTLFEANGGTENQVRGASSEASLLTSLSAGWTPMNPLPQGEHRLYHSLLWLLDNGQVVSTVSNPNNEARSTSLLVFSPPYLFTGTRPQITSAPKEVTYGGTYAVSATATDATVQRMTITSAPSPTHSLDANQRYLSVPVVDGTITVPTSGGILPPGWYRLWAVDTAGRPSVATWIHLS